MRVSERDMRYVDEVEGNSGIKGDAILDMWKVAYDEVGKMF